VKKIAFIALASLSFCLFACTPPTQPIAERALQTAQAGEAAVVQDFSNLAYQASLDKATAAVRATPASAPDVLQQMGHEYEQVAALLQRHERNAQLLAVTKLFVESQKGILNIFWDELVSANAAAKVKEAAASQPS